MGQLIFLAATYAVFGVVLFLCAGRLDWTMGWVLIGLYVLYVLFCAVFVLPRNPQAFDESVRWRPGTRLWDRLWALLYVPTPYVMAAVAGLDAVRFRWSEMPLALSAVGIALLVGGMMLAAWTMLANRYFSTTVHVDSERGHRTVTSGPYRWVRHPSYAGAVLAAVGAPLVLGSWWALVPGAFTAALFVVRTAREDRDLPGMLDGYAEYARRVRYRLLPGLW